jgi:hypothetical protein
LTYAICKEDRDATLVFATKAAGANAVADAKRNAAATESFIFPFSVAPNLKLKQGSSQPLKLSSDNVRRFRLSFAHFAGHVELDCV